MPVAIVIAGILIGGAVFLSPGAGVEKKTTDPFAPKTDLRPVDANDHILGNPNAPVKIVEYSDLECPFCKQFHAEIKQMMDTYGKEGRVAFVYRHFPLDSIHPKARKEAEATECAAELGGNEKFFAYLDRIFEVTPANNGLDAAELPKIAQHIGLDVAKFNECLSSGRHAARVEADFQSGIKAGIEATPSGFLVTKNDEYAFRGGMEYARLKSAIDTLLENK